MSDPVDAFLLVLAFGGGFAAVWMVYRQAFARGKEVGQRYSRAVLGGYELELRRQAKTIQILTARLERAYFERQRGVN